MKLKFLGTSAGELYPGIWCRCANCSAARSGSPRNRRQSAALWIEPADSKCTPILIDFPPEIASQALQHDVLLSSVGHLLVTHSHGDHWHPYQLRWRYRPRHVLKSFGDKAPSEYGGPVFTSIERLHIWGNRAVEAILRRELGEDLEPFEIEFHPVGPGDRFQCGNLDVSAVAANHDVGVEEAVHYIIDEAGQCVLYGLDGDSFLDSARPHIASHRYDAVVLESTYGFGDGRNHRNFERVISEAAWFRRAGLIKETGKVIATHFSPHHCPPHAETEEYLKKYNIGTAWDGREVLTR